MSNHDRLIETIIHFWILREAAQSKDLGDTEFHEISDPATRIYTMPVLSSPWDLSGPTHIAPPII